MKIGLLNLCRISYSNDGKLFSSFHHVIFYWSHSLTVVRPTGVEHVVCIGGEADIQHAPAHVTGLHRSPQVKTPPTGVVQADVLVCSKKKNKTKQNTKTRICFCLGFFYRSLRVCDKVLFFLFFLNLFLGYKQSDLFHFLHFICKTNQFELT